ncbi:MAG: ABC transporter substrate-binding protein, partial [Comamonadaceae bacterium]
MTFSTTRRNTLVMGAALAAQPLRFAHANTPLKIGVLVPLTGAHASDGARILKAHKLAAKQINDGGGIKELGGAKVELVIADIQSKPEVSRSEAERLISSLGVSALVGAWASATTIPAAQVADRNRTPFIVTAAVNDALTEQGMQFVFRIAPKAKWYGDYVADFVDYLRTQGKPVSKIALCTEDGPAGQSVHTNYASVLPKRGMQIVADETFRTGSPDFSTIVSKMKASGAEALMTVAYADDSA